MAERGRPSATTDPYAALAKISDQSLKAAMKQILDQIITLRAQMVTPAPTSTVIADPQSPDDPVNLRTLQQYMIGVSSGAIPPPAERPGPVPLNPGGGEPVPPPATPPSGPIPPTPPTQPPPGTPPSPPEPGQPPTTPPTPTPGPTPPTHQPQKGTGNIRIAGKFLRTPGGSIYRWKGCTDFCLYKKYLDGEDVASILSGRAAQGASLVRVLGMMKNITDFVPANYPTYFSALPTFASFLSSQGFDLLFTIFADAQLIPALSSFSSQVTHLNAVRNALLGSPNVVVELVNEYWQNGVDPSRHTPVTGILGAVGSGLLEDGPDHNPWDFSVLHTGRDNEWPRKAKDAMEFADALGRPAVNDEPMGAAEADIPGRRSTNANDFYWYAATSMLLGSGATFHSEDGIFSRPWGAIQTTCAGQFFAAINAIPENVKGGQYTRSGLSDLPVEWNENALRVFARYTGSDACCVVIRPDSGFTLAARAGWTISHTEGPADSHGDGTLVFLTR